MDSVIPMLPRREINIKAQRAQATRPKPPRGHSGGVPGLRGRFRSFPFPGLFHGRRWVGFGGGREARGSSLTLEKVESGSRNRPHKQGTCAPTPQGCYCRKNCSLLGPGTKGRAKLLCGRTPLVFCFLLKADAMCCFFCFSPESEGWREGRRAGRVG